MFNDNCKKNDSFLTNFLLPTYESKICIDLNDLINLLIVARSQ